MSVADSPLWLQLHRGEEHSSAPVFAFVEGALVSALREGTWLLLDEVNLAPAETLERLAGVLEARALLALRTPFLGCGHFLSWRGPPCRVRQMARIEPQSGRHSPPRDIP